MAEAGTVLDANGNPVTSDSTNSGGASNEDMAALRSSLDGLTSTIDAQRSENQSLKEQLEKQTVAKDTPQTYTRAQLAAYVTANQITQEQADEIIDNQNLAKTKAETQAIVDQAMATNLRDTTLVGERAEYTKLLPNIQRAGHADRDRLEANYQELIKLGDPAELVTEIKALRMTFGSLDAVRSVQEPRRPPGSDGVGAGGGDDGSSDDAPSAASGMDAREKTYYGDLIRQGIYRDWEHANKTFTNKTERRA
jgi:hypothetical protein